MSRSSTEAGILKEHYTGFPRTDNPNVKNKPFSPAYRIFMSMGSEEQCHALSRSRREGLIKSHSSKIRQLRKLFDPLIPFSSLSLTKAQCFSQSHTAFKTIPFLASCTLLFNAKSYRRISSRYSSSELPSARGVRRVEDAVPTTGMQRSLPIYLPIIVLARAMRSNIFSHFDLTGSCLPL